MLPAFLLAPFVAAAAGFALPWHRARVGLLVGFAAAHLVAVGWLWGHPPVPVAGEVLTLDPLGLLLLAVMSAVFAVVAVHTPGYLRRKGSPTTRTYVACSLALLGAMSVAACTRHFGVLWVAIEASTLASAPLVAHRATPVKLEATWKYLMLCSVGVALALLGTFFLGIGATAAPEPAAELTVSALTAAAPGIAPAWLRVAFVLLLVGYGTKMGLAPLHFWLPDAYAEAPSPASALFSGALSNAAFLGVLRVLPVMDAAGQGPFARHLLVLLGLASLLVAAAFLLRQRDLKRLLAYSSVENYGILALGVGLGGVGVYGALLHAVNHALVKTLLFLVAGNLLLVCGTRTVGELRGVAARAPVTGALLAAGFLAIAGTPPFGPFWSEFAVLRAALAQPQPWLAAGYLVLLGAVFAGLAVAVLGVLHGRAEIGRTREPWGLLAAPLGLGAAVLALGLTVPAPLEALLQAAARSLGG